MTREELDTEILAAHANQDAYALAGLYEKASELELLQENFDAAGFLLTHAYVFALESGHPQVDEMKQRLAADGRELNE